MEIESPKIQVGQLNFYYGKFRALIDVALAIPERRITAMIGPSGCGKSTFLRCLNRMNDVIKGTKVTGKVTIEGKDIYAPSVDLLDLRKRVGMVFQRPNPFPLSVFDNVAYGPSIHHVFKKRELPEIVENSLSAVGLWDSLKDRLSDSALSLSFEQQQRLCIARLLPVKPEIILMDEPCSALDPVATQHVEELMRVLKEQYTIVIVTHNMQQAARVSDKTAYFYLGELIEFGETERVFTRPERRETEDYITGRFG